MTLDAQVEALWAAKLTVESIDLAAGRVCLRFATPQLDGSQIVRFVRLESVQSLEFRKHGAPWRHAEASEVGLLRIDRILAFGVVLWAEPSILEIRCLEVWLDDKLIAKVEES